MSPSEELPIEAEALDAAVRAVYRLRLKNTTFFRSFEEEREIWTPYADAALHAAFEAMGMKVERRGQMFPSEKRKNIMEYRDTEQRIVSGWRPVEQDR